MKAIILFFTSLMFAYGAHASIVYSSWTTNSGEPGSYIFSVEHNELANTFDYNFTVDPWDAEGLGLFVDFGDVDIAGGVGLANTNPNGEVSVFATDTDSNNCGGGCNLNGLNPSLEEPDAEWELVFRLGQQGFDSIQTFSWTTNDFGLDLTDFGMVGIRSQQQCSGDDVLFNDPDGDAACGGSDKSYGSVGTITTTGIPIPEPSTVFIFAIGLACLVLRRRI